jgi:elongation factor Ts
MAISASQVKELREKTGQGIMECKSALKESGGDVNRAIEILRKKGLSTAELKKSREAKEGMVFSYIHFSNQVGVLLELNCESDFVAKTEDFQELGKDLAMQIAATTPQYLSPETVPKEVVEKEKEIYREQLKREGKPEKIIDRIIEGKLRKYYQTVCLLEQPYIKNDKITVQQLVKEKIAKLGENIIVRRFARFEVGK